MVVAKSQGNWKLSRAVLDAIIAFVMLAVVTSAALSFLFILGCLPGWELAVTIFTVLVLAAGMIYTVLWFSQAHAIDGR